MDCRHFAIGGARMRTSEFLAIGNNNMAERANMWGGNDTTASTDS